MDLVKIHDKIEAFLNKKLKVKVNQLPQIKTNNWSQAQIKAKTIELKPGWAIFFVRQEGFVDHIAIVPNQEKHKLNLAEAELVNAAPPPIGHGIGPLTTVLTDQSGLRICTALEYINLFQPNYYSMIFVGEPPTQDPQYLQYAGLIAEQIAKTGLIDGKPIVYTFSNVHIAKYFLRMRIIIRTFTTVITIITTNITSYKWLNILII